MNNGFDELMELGEFLTKADRIGVTLLLKPVY